VISWWFVSTSTAKHQTAITLTLLPCAILCCVIWQGTLFQRNLLPSCLEETDAGRFSETILSNYTYDMAKDETLAPQVASDKNHLGHSGSVVL
jgi:hypothetical protein